MTLSIAEVEDVFPPSDSLRFSASSQVSGIDALQPSARARVNRNLLALDLGTKTGWAIYTRDGRRLCGTESFSPRASWSPGQRGLRFRSWLAGMVINHQITGIWYEVVHRHIGTQAAHLYGAYEMLMFMVADQNQLTVDSVGVGTIKKHAAGSGRADKSQIIAAMRAKGWLVDSDNAADAAAIMGWALDREMGLPVDVPKPAKKPSKKAVEPQGALL